MAPAPTIVTDDDLTDLRAWLADRGFSLDDVPAGEVPALVAGRRAARDLDRALAAVRASAATRGGP